jgi:methylenetetrahydrofolate--tRNA-(uracil-5-)-methyltransferase
MGILAGKLVVAEYSRKKISSPPNTTPMGALISHITGGADAKTFQPMNINFGLFPPVENVKGGRKNRKDRYKAYTDRAKDDWTSWLKDK